MLGPVESHSMPGGVNDVVIGQDVRVVGHRCKIAFVGETRFASGEWVGVVFDEAIGKNNGTVQDVKYFNCQFNHGLFVRPSLAKPLDEASDSSSSSGVETLDFQEDMDEGMCRTNTRRRHGVSAEAAGKTKSHNSWKSPVHEKTSQERHLLVEIIKTSKDSKLQMMFGECPRTTLDRIIDAMFLKTVPAGEPVIREGDFGDFFYIVKSGHFDIFKAERRPSKGSRTETMKKMVKVFEIGAGFAFGELALLHNAPRSATVVPTVQSEVWCLERASFQRLVIASQQEKFTQNCEFLQKVDLFSELSQDEIAALCDVLQEEDFEEDEAIVEQGDRDSNMYIIRSGTAVACIQGDQGEIEVNRYSQGDYFGEIALLNGGERQASVYAAGGPATCIWISRFTFIRVLGPMTDVLKSSISKYQKYQEAIEAHPEGGWSKRRSDIHRKSDTEVDIYEGGLIRSSKESNRKKRDWSLYRKEAKEEEKTNTAQQEGPPTSLREKIALDYKNPALVEPDPALEVEGYQLQTFGGLRLGETFKVDKKIAVRTTKRPTKDEFGDSYKWNGHNWFTGSTHVSVLCQKGQKSPDDPTPNQDNFFILFYEGLQIYGVCDGHGPFGHLVSFRLAQALPFHLLKNEHFRKDWPRAMKEAFLSAQSDLLSVCSRHDINVEASGAAGSVLVFEGPCIHIANIGDAGVLVGSWNRHDSRLIDGTRDHKPELPEERARLEAAGSEVREVAEDSYRIYRKGTNFPGLTMSRAFGDTACAGVSREPDYKQIMLQPKDEFYAIIASDGIWEFMDYPQVISLSAKKLRLKGPRECARFIVEASRKRWSYCCEDYCDDITAIVVQWNVNDKDAVANHHLTLQHPSNDS